MNPNQNVGYMEQNLFASVGDVKAKVDTDVIRYFDVVLGKKMPNGFEKLAGERFSEVTFGLTDGRIELFKHPPHPEIESCVPDYTFGYTPPAFMAL